jgi:hypothetical protein
VAPGDVRRIGLRADDYEIIPGDLAPVDPVAFADEPRIRLRVVYQNKISVATACCIERLAVPCANTLTEMSVALVKPGRIAASNPELSTEVVDARMIDCGGASAACAAGASASTARRARARPDA